MNLAAPSRTGERPGRRPAVSYIPLKLRKRKSKPLAQVQFPDPGKCVYPYGDPGKPGFEFCCAKGMPGKPYCEAHMVACYRTVADE